MTWPVLKLKQPASKSHRVTESRLKVAGEIQYINLDAAMIYVC